jgi:peptide/nickel transport system substrate-binding protein
MAAPQDPFIYRPAHFLKNYHGKFADKDKLDQLVAKAKMRSWAPLHNRMDSMLENSNPELPTLFPWRAVPASSGARILFERNPYFHRIDTAGQQLPYVDQVIADVASASLFAAKSNAGEVDFLARGLVMNDIPVLKQGEEAQGYKTLLWRLARGSEVALYPNLTTVDPVWRQLNRDVRFRRALSLAIDRHTINNALLFGLGQEGNNTVREGSALFEPAYRSKWAQYDSAAAAKLLDDVGLAKGSGGIRNLPDGRPAEIVVEVDGDTGLAVDTLELITEFWREVGVKLFIKPQDRTILRNRAYEGQTVMVASQGLDNAIPTAEMVPAELAPVHQDNYAWPRWGQYIETKGTSGEPVDVPEAKKLLDAYAAWLNSADSGQKAAAWHAMLALHADNQWIIGTVAGALQPIVLRHGLANLPAEALYSWAPTSLLGVYRIDEIFWDRQDRRIAKAP